MQPHVKLLILDQVNFFLSLLTDADRKALIGDLSEQQKVLDAKKAEESGKKKPGGGIDDKTVISEYMQKKDDLEFRTLQELNQQMTNWVETVQSQNYAEGSQLDPVDQQLYDQYGLSESSDSGSDSDFLDEKLQVLKKKLKNKKLGRQNGNSGSSSGSSDDDSDSNITSDLNSREESKQGGGKRSKKNKKLQKEKKRLVAEATQMMRQLTNQPKTEQEKATEFSEAYKQASLNKKNGGLMVATSP